MTTQIACLNLLADALGDKLLGFHVAQDMAWTGFLYRVAASSETLGGGLQGLARCSSMINEGVKLETACGDALRIGFEYAGVCAGRIAI